MSEGNKRVAYDQFEENTPAENEAAPLKKESTTEKKAQKSKTQKDDSGKKELSKVKEELQQAKEQLSEQKDAYLRLAAEYENYRRRSAKEKEGVYTDAYADALKALLPTADNLERALKFADSAKVIEGVQMTYDKLQAALEGLGIEKIPCQTFDPNVHTAVMHVEDDAYGENEIVEVFENGYKRGDRIIRYAMVKVAN